MQSWFVNDGLRGHLAAEIAGLTGTPKRLGALMALACLIALAGPFGTFDSLAPVGRLLYWTAVVFGTACVGHAIFETVDYLAGRAKWPVGARLAASVAIASGPVAAVVLLVGAAFGARPDLGVVSEVYGQCVLVIGCIALVVHLRDRPRAGATMPETPALLDRLPGAKRGRLLRLSAQDHYVEVVTDRGSALIKMRLRDAIAEAGPEPGAQVHRSHWVALGAVAGRGTDGTRPGIATTDGAVLPVGRTFRDQARRAGLLT